MYCDHLRGAVWLANGDLWIIDNENLKQTSLKPVHVWGTKGCGNVIVLTDDERYILVSGYKRIDLTTTLKDCIFTLDSQCVYFAKGRTVSCESRSYTFDHEIIRMSARDHLIVETTHGTYIADDDFHFELFHGTIKPDTLTIVDQQIYLNSLQKWIPVPHDFYPIDMCTSREFTYLIDGRGHVCILNRKKTAFERDSFFTENPLMMPKCQMKNARSND